jgi:hypothetical protein
MSEAARKREEKTMEQKDPETLTEAIRTVREAGIDPERCVRLGNLSEDQFELLLTKMKAAGWDGVLNTDPYVDKLLDELERG